MAQPPPPPPWPNNLQLRDHEYCKMKIKLKIKIGLVMNRSILAMEPITKQMCTCTSVSDCVIR